MITVIDMTIRVRFFSTLAEKIGTREMFIEYKPGMTIRDIAEKLSTRFPQLIELIKNGEVLTSRNHVYASLDAEVNDGDEVAFMPPASGG